MSRKIRGSAPGYITAVQASAILHVALSTIYGLVRKGQLQRHSPPGLAKGRYFKEEDVLCLKEARDVRGRKRRIGIENVAMQAVVASKRVERKLEQLLCYLGISSESLRLEEEDIRGLRLKIKSILKQGVIQAGMVIPWAGKMLAITEDYLELVELYEKESKPWVLYQKFCDFLLGFSPAQTKARKYIEHAQRNLRNASYFYVRGREGARKANLLFPGENVTGRLLQIMDA
jgi:hypothetical protein